MEKTFYAEVLGEMPDKAKMVLKNFLENKVNQNEVHQLLCKGSITLECLSYQITLHKPEDVFIIIELLHFENQTVCT